MSKPTEETESETEEGTETAPNRVTEKTQYVCNHCGAKVVPQEIETPSGGITYRCPQCGKFMKPITEKEREEAEAETPLPPPQIVMTERIKELLAGNLPRVYGIPKKEATKTIVAILDTLSPTTAGDPWNLHSHIKNFAPNADDRHLESIIKKIFGQLEVEGYVRTGRGYQPSYGRRTSEGDYRPNYAPRERRRHDYEEDYGDYGGYETRRRRPTRMKVVVDGQEIETDYEGYLAHERWKREQAEENRRAEEHELTMKRIEAEILKITGETGGSKGETLVKVKVGEEEMEVPASIAPLYLKGESEEVKELRRDVKDLTGKLHDKEIGELRSDLTRVSKKLEEQPSFFEQMEMMDKYAETRGYTKTGRTTLDLLSDLGGKADARAQQLINRMPGAQGEFRPEVKRTPEERRRKAGEIEKRLRKKEEVLEAEDELIRAAAKM